MKPQGSVARKKSRSTLLRTGPAHPKMTADGSRPDKEAPDAATVERAAVAFRQRGIAVGDVDYGRYDFIFLAHGNSVPGKVFYVRPGDASPCKRQSGDVQYSQRRTMNVPLLLRSAVVFVGTGFIPVRLLSLLLFEYGQQPKQQQQRRGQG
jgi:hypothetical protein